MFQPSVSLDAPILEAVLPLKCAHAPQDSLALNASLVSMPKCILSMKGYTS